MIDAGLPNAPVLAICEEGDCTVRILTVSRQAAQEALARHVARTHPGVVNPAQKAAQKARARERTRRSVSGN